MPSTIEIPELVGTGRYQAPLKLKEPREVVFVPGLQNWGCSARAQSMKRQPLMVEVASNRNRERNHLGFSFPLFSNFLAVLPIIKLGNRLAMEPTTCRWQTCNVGKLFMKRKAKDLTVHFVHQHIF